MNKREIRKSGTIKSREEKARMLDQDVDVCDVKNESMHKRIATIGWPARNTNENFPANVYVYHGVSSS